MTRTLLLAAAALALLSAHPADAQRVSKLTVAKLLGACGNPKGKLICEAYISGIADGIAGSEKSMTATQGHGFAGATCIPTDTDIAQIRSTVISALRARPDAAGQPAAIPTFEALHAAYPCKGQ